MIHRLKAAIRAFQLSRPTPQRRTPVNSGQSPDRAWFEAMPDLRQWGRHFEQNSDLANGVLDDLVETTVGPGIQVLPQVRNRNGTDDDAMNTALVELWDEWSDLPEVTADLAWSEVQRMTARGYFRDGEYFLATVGQGRGYPWEVWPGRLPFALELLESDLVPWDLNETLRNGRRIINGAEVDTWGRVLAWRVLKEHPGTHIAVRTVDETKRIPASRMIHPARRQRYAQIRGVTVFAAAGRRLHDIDDYDESERIAARTQARISFWKVRQPQPFASQYTSDNPDGEAGNQRSLSLPQGAVEDSLLPGEDIKFAEASRPNTGASEWRADQTRALAAGTGSRHSRVTRRYETSYTAQRAELVDAVHAARGITKYLIDSFIRPVRLRVIQTALVEGRLSNPRNYTLRELMRAEYIPPGIPWIQPDQEVDAAIKAIDAGLLTRDQAIMANGRDPRKVPEPEGRIDERETETT